ncbi:hypothetical protein SNEBB_009944 [Seison nebaliae]|nr:hypothetical protein SNEBB_009944 [Seison nebaliae]
MMWNSRTANFFLSTLTTKQHCDNDDLISHQTSTIHLYETHKMESTIFGYMICFILILGFVGNFLLVQLAMKGSRIITPKILNLLGLGALVDLLYLLIGGIRHISISLNLMDIREISVILCRIHLFSVAFLSDFSAWLYTIIAMQRCFYILFPKIFMDILNPITFKHRRRTIIIIISFAAVFLIIVNAHFLLFWGVHPGVAAHATSHRIIYSMKKEVHNLHFNITTEFPLSKKPTIEYMRRYLREIIDQLSELIYHIDCAFPLNKTNIIYPSMKNKHKKIFVMREIFLKETRNKCQCPQFSPKFLFHMKDVNSLKKLIQLFLNYQYELKQHLAAINRTTKSIFEQIRCSIDCDKDEHYYYFIQTIWKVIDITKSALLPFFLMLFASLVTMTRLMCCTLVSRKRTRSKITPTPKIIFNEFENNESISYIIQPDASSSTNNNISSTNRTESTNLNINQNLHIPTPQQSTEIVVEVNKANLKTLNENRNFEGEDKIKKLEKDENLKVNQCQLQKPIIKLSNTATSKGEASHDLVNRSHLNSNSSNETFLSIPGSRRRMSSLTLPLANFDGKRKRLNKFNLVPPYRRKAVSLLLISSLSFLVLTSPHAIVFFLTDELIDDTARDKLPLTLRSNGTICIANFINYQKQQNVPKYVGRPLLRLNKNMLDGKINFFLLYIISKTLTYIDASINLYLYCLVSRIIRKECSILLHKNLKQLFYYLCLLPLNSFKTFTRKIKRLTWSC